MGHKSQRPTDPWTNLIANDTGTSALTRHYVPKTTGMDAMPGTKIVWNMPGHYFLASRAVDDVLKSLPANLKWIKRCLNLVAKETTIRDITDVLILGHWLKFGQKHHFMRDKSQSEQDAYDAAVAWIFGEAREAVKVLRAVLLWKRPLGGGSNSDIYIGADDSTEIDTHLGNALHSLQDSFAPGHVDRTKTLLIIGIHVYDAENKKTHAAFDESWQLPDGSPSALGQAALEASQMLLKCFIYSAVEPELTKSDATFERRKKELIDWFLAARLGERSLPREPNDAPVPAKHRWYG
jgi:hypothetical protein